MTYADVLRPGPVVGTGQRVLALQRATLASRLSSFATVAAALFRSLSSTDVDPAQLQAQRNRARQLASLIKEIENREESVSYETSELVPRRLWINVKDALNLSSDLDVVLTRLLDDVDTGVYDRGQMATQALVFRRLADQLNDVGRGGLVEASSERPELGHVAGV